MTTNLKVSTALSIRINYNYQWKIHHFDLYAWLSIFWGDGETALV